MPQVVSAELDTDNLKLEDLGDAPGMEIGAELEAIMLTGACIDTAFETPEELHPRGTQLVLQDSRAKPLQDTIVMTNLGYFQLKTAPGALQPLECLLHCVHVDVHDTTFHWPRLWYECRHMVDSLLGSSNSHSWVGAHGSAARRCSQVHGIDSSCCHWSARVVLL